MKAYAKLDNGYPTASIRLTNEEWETLYFETYTLDHDNKVEFPEECYNMMLVHPKSGKVFWGYSADFEWGERPIEEEVIDLSKSKATFNLPLSTIDKLDETWISLKKEIKDQGRITKTLIVERAIALTIEELESKGESSALYKSLVSCTEEGKDYKPKDELKELDKNESRGRGRPQQHQEEWSKVTVVLLEKQIHWLDKLSLDIRGNTKAAVSRSEIIRSLISFIEESGIDLTKLEMRNKG